MSRPSRRWPSTWSATCARRWPASPTWPAAWASPFHEPLISVRTGDTPQRERARFRRDPADILITTPESLYLMLTSQAADALRTVDTVIIDEIHALVPTKRGAHLALTLERLEALTQTTSPAHRPLRHAAPAGGSGPLSGRCGNRCGKQSCFQDKPQQTLARRFKSCIGETLSRIR